MIWWETSWHFAQGYHICKCVIKTINHLNSPDPWQLSLMTDFFTRKWSCVYQSCWNVKCTPVVVNSSRVSCKSFAFSQNTVCPLRLSVDDGFNVFWALCLRNQITPDLKASTVDTAASDKSQKMHSAALDGSGSPRKRAFSRGLSEDESLRSIISEVSEEEENHG